MQRHRFIIQQECEHGGNSVVGLEPPPLPPRHPNLRTWGTRSSFLTWDIHSRNSQSFGVCPRDGRGDAMMSCMFLLLPISACSSCCLSAHVPPAAQRAPWHTCDYFTVCQHPRVQAQTGWGGENGGQCPGSNQCVGRRNLKTGITIMARCRRPSLAGGHRGYVCLAHTQCMPGAPSIQINVPAIYPNALPPNVTPSSSPGYPTPAVLGTHVWTEWLHHPCLLTGPQHRDKKWENPMSCHKFFTLVCYVVKMPRCGSSSSVQKGTTMMCPPAPHPDPSPSSRCSCVPEPH